MKDTFISILKNVFDVIFSFWTFLILTFVFILWFSSSVGEKEEADKEARRAAIELCYAHGMVLVETDAGPRCASPQSLAKLK